MPRGGCKRLYRQAPGRGETLVAGTRMDAEIGEPVGVGGEFDVEFRLLIDATDINPHILQRAAAGVYDVERMPGFTLNHQKSGGTSSLSDYYTAAYGRAVFDKVLKDHIVFSDHSLATDSVFAEVQLISC